MSQEGCPDGGESKRSSTNGLRLEDASLNTRHASLRVNGLRQKDVNPCFQALVLSHRLMPNIESFAVAVDDSEPLIVVSSGALGASMPAWEFAVSNLDTIPLSTFLPANLDARMRHEEESVAIRSSAWIAVDDVLDLIDGSSATWSTADRRLLNVRLRVVELGVLHSAGLLAAPAVRLESVVASVASLRRWIRDAAPTDAYLTDRRHDITQLRSQWEAWGPVPRHPLIADDPAWNEADTNTRRPRLRDTPDSMAFRVCDGVVRRRKQYQAGTGRCVFNLAIEMNSVNSPRSHVRDHVSVQPPVTPPSPTATSSMNVRSPWPARVVSSRG